MPTDVLKQIQVLAIPVLAIVFIAFSIAPIRKALRNQLQKDAAAGA